MSLTYFGAEGAYILTSATTANQMLNIGSTYGSIGGGFDTAVGYQNVMGQAQTQTLTQFMGKISKPAKKAARGILAKLQAEIDGWHGDILERFPV